MVPKPLIIIQLGKPPSDLKESHGDQSDWMLLALAGLHTGVEVVRPHEGDILPTPHEVCGAILTGSWSMVTDMEPWSEATARWIRGAMAADLPLLGICYGHQLMAYALGGRVGFHPEGREIGQHEIRLIPGAEKDPALLNFPSSFPANLTHEQTVLVAPTQAFVLAGSSHDQHQILRYGPNALSVQFHPEFDPGLLAACLRRRQDVFEAEGYDIPSMLESLKPTPHALSILRNFAQASM